MAASAAEVDYGSAPGNWLALEIRRFQEASKHLFPSPKPGDEKVRYNTIYGIDYAPLGREMYKVDTPALLKRSGIRKEAPFALEQAKRFNSWKVRKDLVEVDKVQRKVAERRQTALEASKREEEMLSFPAIKRSQSVALSTERRIEPKAGLKTPILPPGPQISKARTSPKSEVGRSLPASLSAHRYKEIKKDLLEAAEQYMQTTPKPDRRVIDRALSVSNKNYREDLSALHTDLPDTKAEAEKWLEQATPEEQRIALKFFKSVGGMKLMGLTGKANQQERFETLVAALEKGEAQGVETRPTYNPEQKRRERKQRSLQFVRLLSPKTRKTRPEHQSWHHLPDYTTIRRADNVRSHYTQPQKVKPLHFTIHPDWGP